MSAVLGYQQVYVRPRRTFVASFRLQCALVALLVGFVSTKVYVQAEITQLGYRIGTERNRSRELEGAIRELQLARSVLLRPRTLQAEARARLGMTQLQPSQARRIVFTGPAQRSQSRRDLDRRDSAGATLR